jgi:hypothetical protein
MEPKQESAEITRQALHRICTTVALLKETTEISRLPAHAPARQRIRPSLLTTVG